MEHPSERKRERCLPSLVALDPTRTQQPTAPTATVHHLSPELWNKIFEKLENAQEHDCRDLVESSTLHNRLNRETRIYDQVPPGGGPNAPEWWNTVTFWQRACRHKNYLFRGDAFDANGTSYTNGYVGLQRPTPLAKWRDQYHMFCAIEHDDRPLNEFWKNSPMAHGIDTPQSRNLVWLRALREFGESSQTHVHDCEFNDCKHLALTYLPVSIESVGPVAFDGCTSLAITHLPLNLRLLSATSFRGCPHIDTVDFWRGECVERGYLFDGDHPNAAPHRYVGIQCADPLEKWRRQFATFFSVSFDNRGSTPRAQHAQRNINWISRMRAPRLGAKPMVPPFSFMPSPVATLPEAFSDCAYLDLTHLPEGLEVISARTFYGCVRLRLEALPGSLREVCERGFADCRSLALPSGSLASVRTLGSLAFFGCETLVGGALHPELKILPQSAFEGCRSLVMDVLPSNLKTIERAAFNGCTSLVLARGLPSGLNYIGDVAFEGCTGLRIPAIPSNYNGNIRHRTFARCSSLQRVSLPVGTSVIHSGAFAYCTQLTLDTGAFSDPKSALNRIENSAFEGCSALALDALTAPALRDIGENAFRRCGSLVLQGGLTDTLRKINRSCFQGCRSLALPRLPSALKEIDDNAFLDCASLTLAEGLPDRLSLIGHAAFFGCTALAIPRFPSTLVRIKSGAFEGCSPVITKLVDGWRRARESPMSSAGVGSSSHGSGSGSGSGDGSATMNIDDASTEGVTDSGSE